MRSTIKRIVRICVAISAIVTVALPAYGQQAASISVTSHNTSQILDPGSRNNRTTTIRWGSRNVSGQVAIDLFRNGTWQTLFASTANDGQQAWTISGPATSLGRFRVRSVNASSVSDINNADLAIYGPYYRGWYGGYCTELAARGFDAAAPSPGIDWGGYAGTWYRNARNWRRTTDPTAAVPGAIGVWEDDGGLGHVALFTGYARDGSGKITHAKFLEQNWGPIDEDNLLYWWNAITDNFGVVTTAEIPIHEMDRLYDFTEVDLLYTFTGFILPQRR